MIKKLTKKILQQLGYTIVKYPQMIFPVAVEEVARLEKDLLKFAEVQKESIGVEQNATLNWADPKVVRKYLANQRLMFFNELLSVLDQFTIQLDEKKIIDAGAGTGYLLRRIDEKYRDVELIGYEIYDALIPLARYLCPKAFIFNKDIFEENKGDGSADIVFCTEVLEHLIDPHLASEQLYSLVKPEGYLILTVPNGRKDSLPSNGKYPNGKGYYGHINFWSPESWAIFINRKFPSSNLIRTGEFDKSDKYLFAIIKK